MRVIWDIFSGDVRNLFRNVIAAIVVMGLALVPPMYAWFTTLGFWDPYDNTGNIKVAVASEDAGYTSDLIPTPVNAGEQIIGKLRANDQFAWQFVSAEAAVEGVRSGEYYAALVIPKEFSRDLMTVFSDDITEPKIIYYDNEKENAIAQRVTATGASTLQETIDETFTETVASVALGTTSSLTSFMSGDGILTYAQTLGSRLGEAVGEVGAAADQAQAYADLVGSTTSLVNATANILKDAGKAPDATAPLVSEAQEGLTSGRDGLSAASTAAEKALTAADASYDAVARAADEAFATMKDDPAAAQGVLAACRSDVQGLAQAYQTMRDTVAGADPGSPAVGALDRIITQLGTLEANLATAEDVQGLAQAYQTMRDTVAGADPGSPAVGALDRIITQLGTLEANLATAESAIGGDAASIDEAHTKVTDSINQARAGLHDSMSTYNDQLKGELASLADSLQKVGADTETLAGSLKDTADSLGASTDSLAANLATAEASLRKTAETLRTAESQLAQARDDLQHALDTGDIDEVRRIIANLATAEASLRKTAETLRTAESQLAQARDDLQHALDTGDIDEVRRIIGDNPAAIAQFLAAPTHLERHAVYPMADNGSAMSPFYTSLALWIGAIFMVALMSVTVSPARQAALTKKFGRAPRPGELYLGRYGVFCLIGLAQALIVGLGNVFFLGVECQHFWLYLAACCLASVVFTNLVYTLTVSFGNIGKALAIIGLVLQLAGAGGLMPVQMLSAPLFQEIYPWLPFAHSMPALEGAMAGIYGDQYLVQMGLLAAILVPSLILGLVLRRPVIRLNDWVLRKLGETKFL